MSEPKRIRILVVDDSPITLVGLKTYVDQCLNLEIVGEATNGRDAISKARELKPDIVIMDADMPALNGLDATREIKRNHPEVRVLILTGHEDYEDMVAAMEAGADGFSLKTILAKQLKLAIEAITSGAKWFDPESAARALRRSQSPE